MEELLEKSDVWYKKFMEFEPVSLTKEQEKLWELCVENESFFEKNLTGEMVDRRSNFTKLADESKALNLIVTNAVLIAITPFATDYNDVRMFIIFFRMHQISTSELINMDKLKELFPNGMCPSTHLRDCWRIQSQDNNLLERLVSLLLKPDRVNVGG